MIRSQYASFVALAVISGTAISCHESGTWENDQKNWRRIFRALKPPDVEVVHSWFWRSPHFTYECEYYVQIRKNPKFQDHLISMNNMHELTTEQLRWVTDWSQHRPNWFAPNALIDYRVLVYPDVARGQFTLLIDRQTGDLFLYDVQLWQGVDLS